MSRKADRWDTQSNISLSAAIGLTRAGTGVMPDALTQGTGMKAHQNGLQ